MKRTCFAGILACLLLAGCRGLGGTPPAAAARPADSRQRLCLNGAWEFKSNADKDWSPIRVPGSYCGQKQGWGGPRWAVWDYPDRWAGKGGVYRRTFQVPATMRGQPLRLWCGGARHHAVVRLNGEIAGRDDLGFFPFAIPLPQARPEGDNLLEVEITDQDTPMQEAENSRSCRGLWQDVFLETCPGLHVGDDRFIQTSVRNHEIRIDLPVVNATGQTAAFSIRHVVTDAAGNEVLAIDGGRQELAAGESRTFSQAAAWAQPRLWSVDTPVLYHCESRLLDSTGTLVDSLGTRFGFREIEAQGPRLLLNGRELHMRGDGIHYLGDLEGSKAYAKAYIRSMKAAGVNAARLHVAIRPAEWLEAADEDGFLLLYEAAHHFRPAKEEAASRAHLERMVKSHRNHPSIIAWSVSNEFRWGPGAEAVWMIDQVKALDASRLVFASDFSPWSRHGDVVSHHYDPGRVWSDWEKLAPGKPLVWDELADTWQTERPVRNGTAGGEIAATDWATGTWNDAWDQVVGNLKVVDEPRVFAGEPHRPAYLGPWHYSFEFFRWLPTNKARRLQVAWDSLAGPGQKIHFVNPCATTANIWDPTLPAMMPNPGYYLLRDWFIPVRFRKMDWRRTWTAGETATLSGRLFYDDLRPADQALCRIESRDGKILAEVANPMTLVPGQIVEPATLRFQMPEVREATPANLVVQFANQGEPGWRETVAIVVLPKDSDSPAAGREVLVAAADPALAGKLARLGCQARPAEAGTIPPGPGIVVCDDSLDESRRQQLAAAGHRVIALLPGTPSPAAARPRLPFGGAPHQLFGGIGQEAFTAWRGTAAKGLLPRPVRQANARILLNDKDGEGAILAERMLGNGLLLETSLCLADSFETEPAARWLLARMVRYADDYRPARPPTPLLFAGPAWTAWLADLGLAAEPGTRERLAPIAGGTVVVAPDADPRLLAQASRELQDFVDGGGTLLVCGVAPGTLEACSAIAGRPLKLTDPYLGERSRCIKAPVSWALASTPADLDEYFDGILVPSQFERNLDPLVAGLCNRDLAWNGQPMFTQGLEIAGMDPTVASQDHAILVSNWRIDTTRPDYGAFYTFMGFDLRQAYWFVNRDPVLLRINRGRGRIVFNQLDLPAGGDPARRFALQLFTNLGCPVGGDNALPALADALDLAPQQAQLARFQAIQGQLAPAVRLYYGKPKDLEGDIVGTRFVGGGSRKILFLDAEAGVTAGANDQTTQYTGAAIYTFRWSKKPMRTSADALEAVPEILAAQCATAMVSSGMDDLKLGPDGKPMVSAEAHAATLAKTIRQLAEAGIKVYYANQPPLPDALRGTYAIDQVEAYNAATEKAIENLKYYPIDLHRFIKANVPEMKQRDTFRLTNEENLQLRQFLIDSWVSFGG